MVVDVVDPGSRSNGEGIEPGTRYVLEWYFNCSMKFIVFFTRN